MNPPPQQTTRPPPLRPVDPVVPAATIPEAAWSVVALCLILAVPIAAVLLLDRAVAPHWTAWPDGPWSRPVRTVILAVPALLALPAHEVGHAIAAALAGLRTIVISLGPLLLVRSPGQRLRVQWTRNPGQWGGLTAAVPTEARSSHLTRRMIAMTAGGPAASIGLGVLALVANGRITAARTEVLPTALSAVAVGLLGFATLSLTLGVVTLIPNTSFGMPSDGHRLLRLLRRGLEPGERAQILINGALRHGRRPRDWPPAATQAAGESEDAGTLLLAYYAYLDRAEVDMAGRVLQRALEQVEAGAPIRSTLEAEAASYEARLRDDPGAAREWLDRALTRGGLAELLAARAEALVLAAEGRDASAARDRSLGLISGIGIPGMTAFESDWLPDRTESEI